MVRSAKLWHVIPMDIGVIFYDSANSALVGDAQLYSLVNSEILLADKNDYSSDDWDTLIKIHDFLKKVKRAIRRSPFEDISTAVISSSYPGITGCILHICFRTGLQLHICLNGTAVFFEYGDDIEFTDEAYFSIPMFRERQEYEDDYCINEEVSERKRVVYEVADILWACADKKDRAFSGSSRFRNHGISYVLCISVIDIPNFNIVHIDDQLRKNCYALIETSAFNNIYDEEQWPLIKNKIDSDNFSEMKFKQLSESLAYADSWSGVVVVGDIEKNSHALDWLIEAEVYLQSRWLLYEAISEDIMRKKNSSIELQKIKNIVELSRMKLANDISSNMEQARHELRASLIKSSDIDMIYSRMHAVLDNQLKLSVMEDNKRKERYSLISEASLFVMAVIECLEVIKGFITQETIELSDIIIFVLIAAISVFGVLMIAKGK